MSTKTAPIELFIEELNRVTGGKSQSATTLALGEEDGGSRTPPFPPGKVPRDKGGSLTTLAVGEEDGGAAR